MLLQIHDELVFETPDAQAQEAKVIIVERMEAAMDLKVPLTVDAHVSSDWFGGK
jgi:DNA polymerase-1